MVEFKDLTIQQLRKIVKEYNLHVTIQNFSKLKKDELINEIQKHLYIENEQIKQKTEKFEQKAPYTTATQKSFGKSYDALLKLKNVAPVDENLLKFYKDNMKVSKKLTKKQQAKIDNFVNNFDEVIKQTPEKKTKSKSKVTKKEAKEEILNAEDAIKQLQEMISKKEEDIKFWDDKLKSGKGLSGASKYMNASNELDRILKYRFADQEDELLKFIKKYPELKLTENQIIGIMDRKNVPQKRRILQDALENLIGKGLSGGRRLEKFPNLTLEQYYQMYGRPLERSAPQFGEGEAGDKKYKEYMDKILYNYERRKEGWSPINPTQAQLTERHNKIVEAVAKQHEEARSPQHYYKEIVEGRENEEVSCPFNNAGGIDLDKWTGKPTGFKTTNEQCFMNTFYNTKTGKLDANTAVKRRRALMDAQNREVSGWEQFKRGFTGSLETFAKPLLDITSVIPGIGAVSRGLSTAIDFLPSADNSIAVGEGLLGKARPPKIFGNGKPNGYALHAVLIKKSVPLEKAKEHAQEIMKNKKQFYRETKNQYRFRNIAKTKFIKKTFKSKKINPDITLVFGQLTPENMHLEGSGLFDWIKKGVKKVKEFFSPRLDSYNNTSTETIKKYGNLPINSLQIYRTPIASVLETVLNFISLGKFTELKRKAGFDKLFHLALVANVNGKNIIMEKNEAVNVSTSYKTSKDTEVFNIPLNNKSITIYELLEKARNKVGDKTFFDYNAFTNNCQFFIKYLLENSDLYSDGAKNFLFQDLKSIYENLPSYVPKIAKAVTTTGAIFNKITGQGAVFSRAGRSTVIQEILDELMISLKTSLQESRNPEIRALILRSKTSMLNTLNEGFKEYLRTEGVPNDEILDIDYIFDWLKEVGPERRFYNSPEMKELVRETKNALIGDWLIYLKLFISYISSHLPTVDSEMMEEILITRLLQILRESMPDLETVFRRIVERVTTQREEINQARRAVNNSQQIHELQQEMERIEEEAESMPEGEYLRRMNELRDRYRTLTGTGLCSSKPKAETPSSSVQLRRVGADTPFPLRSSRIVSSELPSAVPVSVSEAVVPRASSPVRKSGVEKRSVREMTNILNPQHAVKGRVELEPAQIKPLRQTKAERIEPAKQPRPERFTPITYNPLNEPSNRKLPIGTFKKTGRGKKQKKYN